MKHVVLLNLFVNTTLQSANIVKVRSKELSSDWSCFVCCLSVGDVRCSTRRIDLAKQLIFPWLLFCLRLPFKNIEEGVFRLQLFAFALSVGGLSLFGFSMSLKCKLQY